MKAAIFTIHVCIFSFQLSNAQFQLPGNTEPIPEIFIKRNELQTDHTSNIKSPGHYSAADWRNAIDSVWDYRQQKS